MCSVYKLLLDNSLLLGRGFDLEPKCSFRRAAEADFRRVKQLDDEQRASEFAASVVLRLREPASVLQPSHQARVLRDPRPRQVSDVSGGDANAVNKKCLHWRFHRRKTRRPNNKKYLKIILIVDFGQGVKNKLKESAFCDNRHNLCQCN
jgi:hypothetical protein